MNVGQETLPFQQAQRVTLLQALEAVLTSRDANNTRCCNVKMRQLRFVDGLQT
jgi:hypothetical protein